MVKSEINDEISYNEKNNIEDEDVELETITYEIAFGKIDPDKYYTITFGKPRYDKKKNGIIYFPMYLLVNKEVESQIGILETKTEDINSIYDEDGDLDGSTIREPLLYSFVNKKYLESFIPIKEMVIDLEEELEKQENKNKSRQEIEKETQYKKENELFEINPEKITTPVEVIDPQSIFKTDKTIQLPPILSEESKQDAEELKQRYNEKPSSEWIEKYMKNNNYKIIDNEGGGDCFFAVIRDAFIQVGKHTTVDKLRELLASELTDDVFNEYRGLYITVENSILESQNIIKTLTETNKLLKTRIKNVTTRKDAEELIKQANENNIQLIKLKQTLKDDQDDLNYNLGFMKNINSMEGFKNYIRTSSYWADTWAISTLEYKLNIKLIIMSEEAFDDGSLDSVLNCGEINKNIEEKGTFSPEYYIMTSYTGKHYQLINYKNKNILKFHEIPYDIKMLVLNKCLERNSGIYYLIQEFRNLKTKIGLSPDEGVQEDNEIESYLTDTLYDPKIKFVFYNKSQKKPIPGKGSGEEIPSDQLNKFKNLAKVDNWRRKLDDEWIGASFMLDGHKWASVEHYYQGSKFKKGYPDFYLKFALDSKDSLFNEDVELAREAGGKKNNDFRPKTVKIDPDFYGERYRHEKHEAIKAKYEQNIDLKEMLKATYPAKLVKFVRGSKPEIADVLMNVRKELIEREMN
jgi:predicted NAD-dependent protein-ADP-ribosyltransferase YbiA (DUF1768 family)